MKKIVLLIGVLVGLAGIFIAYKSQSQPSLYGALQVVHPYRM